MRTRVRTTLRDAGIAEVPLLSAMHAGCFEESWSPQSMLEVLTSPGVRAWIAVSESGHPHATPVPMGFAIARVAADESELLSIGVLEQFRRCGVAAALLAEVIRYATERGARRLFLEVAENNSAAQSLYAAHGFSPVGRRPGYYRSRDGAPLAALTLRRYLASQRWRWSGF